MPLSEHEQRLLAQMERALYEDDPKLATTLRGGRLTGGASRRFGLAAIGFLIGVGLLLLGVAQGVELISILGFVQMLISVTYVISWWGRPKSATSAQHPSGQSPQGRRAKRGGSVMDRAEERWRRRSEDGL